MRRFLAFIAMSGLAATAMADLDLAGGDLSIASVVPLGESATLSTDRAGTAYSNVTNFLGQGVINGGAAVQAGNTITRLVADDLGTINSSNVIVDTVKFAVANFNTTTVSVRPRIRFWSDNGSGAPGLYYVAPGGGAISGAIGFTFNPIALAPGVTILTATLAPTSTWALTPGVLWAGCTFDNNTGGTGATLAQMNNMGMGLFNPPTVGTSNDAIFTSTAAGSLFGTNNPAGIVSNFGGSPVANIGWELTPEPTSVLLIALGALLARRR